MAASMNDYTSPRPFEAEGARVALVTCRTCGAAVLLDPADKDEGVNSVQLHSAWHEKNDRGSEGRQ